MKTVAVIGASSNRGKFGNKALARIREQGLHGVPDQSHGNRRRGAQAFKSVLDVPGTIDMATLYVPAASASHVLDEIVKKGIPEVWLNPGADDRRGRREGARRSA